MIHPTLRDQDRSFLLSDTDMEHPVYKNCNFEPFFYVIKSVLLEREETFLIGSIPSFLTNQMTIPFNKLPCSFLFSDKPR